MNHQNFCFMRRGQYLAPLLADQLPMLEPINIRGDKRDRVLLLLHGFASSPAVFRALIPELIGYDAIVCPVLPGHACDLATFADVQARDWFALVDDTCKTLLEDFAAVDVLGLSLGGVLACHLSHKFPINRLFLLAPAFELCTPITLSLLAAKLLKGLGVRFLSNAAGNLYTDDYAELTYRKLPLATIIEILTMIKHLDFKPPTCPTTLFLGRFDKVVHSARVAARFANSPNVSIHWLEHSAHILPLDGDIKAIIECINQKSQA